MNDLTEREKLELFLKEQLKEVLESGGPRIIDDGSHWSKLDLGKDIDLRLEQSTDYSTTNNYLGNLTEHEVSFLIKKYSRGDPDLS